MQDNYEILFESLKDIFIFNLNLYLEEWKNDNPEEEPNVFKNCREL